MCMIVVKINKKWSYCCLVCVCVLCVSMPCDCEKFDKSFHSFHVPSLQRAKKSDIPFFYKHS